MRVLTLVLQGAGEKRVKKLTLLHMYPLPPTNSQAPGTKQECSLCMTAVATTEMVQN